MDETTTSRRPGGRSARVRDDVYSAVGRLIGRGPGDPLTVPQIAAEAGVNPTSIYRRWGSAEALCAEVAVAALTGEDQVPDTGSLDTDLTAWAHLIARDIERPARTVYLRALVSARSGIGIDCPCWNQRVAQAELMIARARERGEPTPSARQVADHIVAPLYHHAVFALHGGPAYADELIADVMAMVA